MRRRWKWISALVIAALLGCGWWLRQRSAASPPVPARRAAVSPPLAPRWPAGISIPTRKSPARSEHFEEIEVCGVGKIRLDPDDATGAEKQLDALAKNS